MSEKRILHLTLKKKWFDMIASGEKKEEYREIKPYWIIRLVYAFTCYANDPKYASATCKGKEFDEIHFKNGYGRFSRSGMV